MKPTQHKLIQANVVKRALMMRSVCDHPQQNHTRVNRETFASLRMG